MLNDYKVILPPLMQDNFKTDRLLLDPIGLGDADFMVELLNSPDWIRFIGERHVGTTEAAQAYIQKMMQNPDVRYWVVKLQEGRIPLGIITFIKRDYLEHHDIGFAFLPEYSKQGFAYEATAAVLSEVRKDASHPYILATTKRDNLNSIKLLQRLGLMFQKEIQVDGQDLLLYSMQTKLLK